MDIVIDLRERFGVIRDQGPRPTCLAMAATDLHGSHQGSIILSAEYLFYQGVRRMNPPNPHRGLTSDVVSVALDADGQPLETAWPYHSTQPDPWVPPQGLDPLWRGAIEFEAVGAKEAASKIKSGVPLVLGLSLTHAFFKPDTAGHLPLKSKDAATPHRHAVVGLGAAYCSEGDLYVLVRNSWGASWGLDGHAWLPVSYLDTQLLWIGSMSGATQNETH